MKIGIIDNDFVSRKNHNFPNLALMKISAKYKRDGNNVSLIGFDEINPNNLFTTDFNKIVISKAFTDSFTPDFVYKLSNVEYGGTGFYYDKATPLSEEIEHLMPDYSLYDNFLPIIKNTKNYTDFSIGFTTRGCFRHCPFCVNKNYNKVSIHSDIEEFYDESRPKITMLDDNILGISNKHLFPILDKFKSIGKPIQYKQGMDIRLITEERAKRIIELKYEGDYYFAFDMWKNRYEIIKKLDIWHSAYYSVKNSKSKRINTNFYVFCAFDYENKWDLSFWLNDIKIIFERIKILFTYGCLPFVMRYEEFKNSPFRNIYITITQWSNQPANCAKYSFLEYIDVAKKKNAIDFLNKYPEFREYFKLKLNDIAR